MNLHGGSIFGHMFYGGGMRQLARVIAKDRIVPGEGAKLIVTANVDHVVELRKNHSFFRAYEQAWVRTVDGMPVYIYARLRGFKIAERVTGSDLIKSVLHEASGSNVRCFFLISSERLGQRLDLYLSSLGVERSCVKWVVPPFGFEKDQEYEQNLIQQIGLFRPTHLIIGLGAPKSEIWSARNLKRLGDCYVLAVGGGLEMLVGMRSRAPKLVQNLG